MLNKIIKRYETDSEIISEKPFNACDLDNWNFKYVFPRLERAAINQIENGGATISRYANWTETIHGLLSCCIYELKKTHNTEKIRNLLTMVTNSIGAFHDIQAMFDPFDILKIPKYLHEVDNACHGIQCKNAYFVKLGKEGIWENSSIKESKIRIGWKSIDLQDINSKKWESVRQQLAAEIPDKGSVTRDFKALSNICESCPDDIWITFHASKLWWTKAGEETIYEDEISKYRKTSIPWSSTNIKGDELLINKLPGSLSKTQGFRGTICKVDDKQALLRIINDNPSKIHTSIESTLNVLQISLEDAIKQLHWKDFETFVDLIFRGSGWRRISMLGESMKFSDIELEYPITHDKYQVQVKSTSTQLEFQAYVKQFSHENFRKLFYVVHSPDEKLSMIRDCPSYVELIKADKLAKMAIDLGLANWLLQKIK